MSDKKQPEIEQPEWLHEAKLWVKEQWHRILLGVPVIAISYCICSPYLSPEQRATNNDHTRLVWYLIGLAVTGVVALCKPRIITSSPEKYFITRVLTTGITGGAFALLLPIAVKSTTTGVGGLRHSILLATGGLLAILTLGETRRKNDIDKDKSDKDHRRQVRAERREQYTKAVEQLGDEKAPVRMGGVYTLVGLVDEWLKDESIKKYEDRLKEGQVIINNLCAYIRSPFNLASHYDELSKANPTPKGIYKGKKEKFYADKATLDSEADVRLGIIKEIHDRLQGSGKNAPGAWSDFEYDFSGSTFFYTIDLTNSYYAKPINFSGSTYQGGTYFSDSTYQDWANFSDSTYQGSADFSDSTYQDWANFNGSTYKGRAYFRDSIYKGRAYFRDSIYKGGANFHGSTYQWVDFSGSDHQGSADFRNSTYQGWAGFRDSIYKGRAYFRGSIYEGRADFRDSTYQWVDFSGSNYQWVDFRGSNYQGSANFSDSTYQDWANFNGSTYKGRAYFRGSNYQGSANFRDSIYKGRAYFRGSIYEGRADFRDSTYPIGADFRDSTYQWVDFSGSNYQGSANFRGSTYKGRANFRSSTYQGGANFNGSTYKGRAYFRNSTYQDWAYFRNSTYQGWADFSGSIYEGRADFRNSTYQGGANFSGSTYKGRANFRGSTYKGRANFRGSTYKDVTDFSGSIFYQKVYFGTEGDNSSFSRFTDCAPRFYDETNHKNALFGSNNNDFTVENGRGYPIYRSLESLPLGCKFLTSEQKEYLEYKFQEIDETNNKLLEAKDDEEKARLSDMLRSLYKELHEWQEEATTVKAEDAAPGEEDN